MVARGAASRHRCAIVRARTQPEATNSDDGDCDVKPDAAGGKSCGPDVPHCIGGGGAAVLDSGPGCRAAKANADRPRRHGRRSAQPAFAGKSLMYHQSIPASAKSTKSAADAVTLKSVHGFKGPTEFLVADIIHLDERGRAKADIASLLHALDWMRAQQADIVIVGFGDTQNMLAKEAIARLASQGTAVIVLAPPR